MAVVKIVLTDDDENEGVNVTTELDEPVDDENPTASQMLAMQIVHFMESITERVIESDKQKETE
jgi:hypothetical protein